MLIEILVSALVLTIASIGVVALLQTTTRSQAELRHSSEAYALAQEDQARLASTRLATLNNLNSTRPVTLDNTTFTVRSQGRFINDSTSVPSCGVGTSSADYVEITSIVTWPAMSSAEKAKIVSVLSPSNGSLDPNHGSLAVSVKTKPQVGVPGVYVSVGSSGFGAFTDASGCAVFADLPAGDYTLSVSGEGKVVNKNGSYTETKPITVVGGDTKTENFEFDSPGTIPVNFKYRVGSSPTQFNPSKADSVMALHIEMTEARTFWTPTAALETTVNATPLFPFTSTYRLFAGSCAANNPDPEGKGLNPAAVADVVAPAGGTAPTPTLQLPAFDPTVWSGRNSSNKGLGLGNADVWVRDTTCTKSSQPVTRRYTTNSSGKLTDLGLPWGTYNLCADTEPGNGTSGVRRQRISAVPIQSLAASTTRDFYLGTGSGSVYESGSCP